MAALLVCVSLTGCGLFYWVKPGASLEDFNRDNTDCIAQTSPSPEAARYGLVVQEAYRACLRARSWPRERCLATVIRNAISHQPRSAMHTPLPMPRKVATL